MNLKKFYSAEMETHTTPVYSYANTRKNRTERFIWALLALITSAIIISQAIVSWQYWDTSYINAPYITAEMIWAEEAVE